MSTTRQPSADAPPPDQQQDNTSLPRSSAPPPYPDQYQVGARTQRLWEPRSSAAEFPNRCRYAFTSLAYIKQQLALGSGNTCGGLQHFSETTTMETLLKTNQAPEHRPDNRIDNPSTTTRTWLLQSILSTPPKLQLHPVPVLGESPECKAPPPRMQSERKAAGITRETTLYSLLPTSKGTTMLQNFRRIWTGKAGKSRGKRGGPHHTVSREK